MRASYKRSLSRISDRARKLDATLEDQAKWAFRQRERIRARYRKELGDGPNNMFKPKDRTFEGELKKYRDQGMTREEALNKIIDSAAGGTRGSADVAAEVAARVTCAGSRARRTRC